jgi:hypothetical protein
MLLIFFGGLDDRCNKFFHEWETKQLRPVGVNEVDEKTFDVRSVLILISHDHELSIAKRL